VALLQQSNNNVNTSEINEDMSFFQSLNPYFMKLDPIQKLRVRNKFQNILIYFVLVLLILFIYRFIDI